MRNHQQKFLPLISLLLVAALLVGCTPQAPQTVIQTVIVQGTPQIVTQEVKVIETQVVERLVTPTPETPQVGGKLVRALQALPDKLDPTLLRGGFLDIGALLNSTLVAVNPATKEIVPYLAESWKVSEDNLVWTFYLRKDVKFHNGDPLTAQDFAFTISRTLTGDIDPQLFGQFSRDIVSVDAPDANTLVITLGRPSAVFLIQLAMFTNLGPVNQKQVEAEGANFGKAPLGVGPYKLKEWVPGEKLVLERNPDFIWGPSFTHQGPAYIQEVEFRGVAEPATIVAGLEAGEIHLANLAPTDLDNFRSSPNFNIYEAPTQGMFPVVMFNFDLPPFQDIRVRQAMNYAVNREAMIKLVTQGNGEVQWGPISRSTNGYWPGVEYIGYDNDLNKAKTILEQAGYVMNASGVYEKDGVALAFTLKTDAGDTISVKTAEVLREQLRAAGFGVEIQQMETNSFFDALYNNDFEFVVSGFVYYDADVIWFALASEALQGYPPSGNPNFPELDELLAAERVTMDQDARQQILNDIQKYVVDNALLISLFTTKDNVVTSSRIHGIQYKQLGDPRFHALLYDAWIK